MIEYGRNGRMKYHTDYHDNHGKPFSKDDLIYICSMWNSMKKADIALAVGKTHGAVLSKVYYLRKQGLFNYYKKLGDL